MQKPNPIFAQFICFTILYLSLHQLLLIFDYQTFHQIKKPSNFDIFFRFIPMKTFIVKSKVQCNNI